MEEEEKLYYTIGEVAEKFKVAQSLIRFWETEFPRYINPKRNKRGVRQYTQKDIENLEKIYVLVKKKKFTLDGAKKALRTSIILDNPDEEIETDIVTEDDVIEDSNPEITNGVTTNGVITNGIVNNNPTEKDILIREKLSKIKELAEKLLAGE